MSAPYDEEFQLALEESGGDLTAANQIVAQNPWIQYPFTTICFTRLEIFALASFRRRNSFFRPPKCCSKVADSGISFDGNPAICSSYLIRI